MQVLTTILYIVLFLVFLSILIIIHELGHLAAAKAFKVYCLEYSIGMGPAIFKHRGKNKETQFSIRAIPFGGYVSMYGEGVELPEGVVVDESRSLNNIKPWKRAIVLLAGVTMNAVLALVFFFISNCFPKDYTDYINHLNVAESSIAASAGLSDGGYIKFSEFQYYDSTAETTYVYYMADNTTTFNGDDTVKYATCFYFESPLNPKKLDLADHILFYELKNDPVGLYSKNDVTDYSNKTIYIADNVDNADLAFKLLKDNGVIASYSVEKFNKDNLDYEVASAYHDLKIECVAMTDLYKKVDSDEIAVIPFSYLSIDWNDATVTAYQKLVSDNYVPDFTKYIKPEFTSASVNLIKRVDGPKGGLINDGVVTLNITQTDGVVNSFGCSVYYKQIKYTFPQIIKNTFVDFGRCSIILFQTIGELFTKASAWSKVGGIVAVGFETTSVLKTYGFGVFLFYWGFISVNLAIFNLLPFPGLDGWQLLVLIVETTTRKKIPEKVKNIVSLVGIGLLLLLMGVVVIKDLIHYVFAGVCLL